MKFLFFALSFSFLFASSSFAIGTIELDPKTKNKIELDVRNSLLVPQAQVVVSRIGGGGLVSHNFKLGKLSESQFQNVKRYFALPLNPSWPSTAWDPMRNYELQDFLLPKMQAAIGKSFYSIDEVTWLRPLNGEPTTPLEFETNCWSTAYDVLRSDAEPLTSYLFVPNDKEVAAQLRDPQYSQAIKASELKPYDFILFLNKDESGQISIDHVSISLGMNLVFEKTGNSELDAYVVSTLGQTTKLRQALNKGNGSSFFIEYRRLKKTLPQPLSLWSAKAKKQISDAQLEQVPSRYRDLLALDLGEDGSKFFSLIRPIRITQNTDKNTFSFDSKDPMAKQFKTFKISGFLKDATHGFADSDLKVKVCQIVGEEVLASVLNAEKNGFFVQISSLFLDVKVSCVDSSGKSVPQFWVPVTSVESMN